MTKTKVNKFPHILVQYNTKKKKLDVLLTDEGKYKWFDTEVAAIDYMKGISMKNADALKNVYSLSAAEYAEMKFHFNFMHKYPASVRSKEDPIFNRMSEISFELDSMGIVGCLPPMDFLLGMLHSCTEDKVDELASELSTCEPVFCRSCHTVCLSPPLEKMSHSELDYFSSNDKNNFYCTYCGAARIIGIMEYQDSLYKLGFSNAIIKLQNTVASKEVLKINKLIADYGDKYLRKSIIKVKHKEAISKPAISVTESKPWLN
jgi:hypothetical protein